MSWYLYLIECRNGHVYTGIATDIGARYAAHAAGRGARYTRANPPRRLLAAFACADRSAATRAERAFKKLAPAEKHALAERNPDWLQRFELRRCDAPDLAPGAGRAAPPAGRTALRDEPHTAAVQPAKPPSGARARKR